jgi:MarR family transcriptional regulator, organic hydroperoxide resistance regulator
VLADESGDVMPDSQGLPHNLPACPPRGAKYDNSQCQALSLDKPFENPSFSKLIITIGVVNPWTIKLYGVMDKPNEIVYALVELTFEMADQTNAAVDQTLADLDLTHALANALWRLAPEAARFSMKDLAQSLRCDPSTVTFLADRLEEKGLVTRRINPLNRRVRMLELTSKGRSVRLRLIQEMTSGSPMARLSLPEKTQLLRLLTKAVGGIRSSTP